MENKVIAVQVSEDLKNTYGNLLEKREGFTTNIDYIGHDSTGRAVYVNAKLKKGEFKEIMQNEQYKEIKPGSYECQVRQIIRKHGKDLNGNEDQGKDIIVIELDVKGQDNYVYMSFFTKGYSDISMKISQEHMDKIIEKFGVGIIEEIAGCEGTLTVKVNDKGYTNMYLAPKKNFYDWGDMFRFDAKGQFECEVKRFYKTAAGNKYNFLVEATVDGNKVVEYVCYDLEKDWAAQKFERILKRLNLTTADADTDLVDKKAKLSVERKTVGDKVFYNKNIVFDKIEKEHFWK